MTSKGVISGGGSDVRRSVIEITGPIVSVSSLCHTFADVSNDFSVTSYVSSNTAAFDVVESVIGGGNVNGGVSGECNGYNGGEGDGVEWEEVYNSATKEITFKDGSYFME